MNKHPIIVEALFNASCSKVWKALTDKEEMKKWYFDLKEFKPEVGFEFEFAGGPSPDKQYLHLCEVVEVIPEKKLSYSWNYDEYAGHSLVIFELSAQGSKTLLRLTHEGLHTFPKENKDFERNNFEEGWDQIINISLKKYLEK